MINKKKSETEIILSFPVLLFQILDDHDEERELDPQGLLGVSGTGDKVRRNLPEVEEREGERERVCGRERKKKKWLGKRGKEKISREIFLIYDI